MRNIKKRFAVFSGTLFRHQVLKPLEPALPISPERWERFSLSPATVLICKLEFVIFEEVIHKDSEFAHASGECDQRFFTGGAQASIKLF